MTSRSGEDSPQDHATEIERLKKELERERAESHRLLRHTRSLREIAVRLGAAQTPEDVTNVVLQATVGLAVVSAGIWLVDHESATLRMLGSRGYPDTTRFNVFSIDADVPICIAVREREAVWLASWAEFAARFPQSEAQVREIRRPLDTAIACVPIEVDQRVIGAMALTFMTPHLFDQIERDFIVTIAQQAAQAIERSKLFARERSLTSHLETIVGSTPTSLAAVDRDGIVHLWNPAAERVFGWTAEEALGHVHPAITDADRTDYLSLVRRVIGGERITGIAAERQRKDGSRVPVRVWAVPMQLTDGSVQCLSITLEFVDDKR